MKLLVIFYFFLCYCSRTLCNWPYIYSKWYSLLPRAFKVGNEVRLFLLLITTSFAPSMQQCQTFSLLKSLKPQAKVECGSACSVKKYPKYFIAPSYMRRTVGIYPCTSPILTSLSSAVVCTLAQCLSKEHAFLCPFFCFFVWPHPFEKSHRRIQYTIYVLQLYVVQ